MLVVTYTASPRTTELYPNGELNTKPLVDNVGSALAQFYPDNIITPECQLKIALAQKMSNGVSCFVTQPLWFDPELVPDVMFIIESDDLELASEQTFVDYLLNPSEENLIESPTEGVKMAVNYIREAVANLAESTTNDLKFALLSSAGVEERLLVAVFPGAFDEFFKQFSVRNDKTKELLHANRWAVLRGLYDPQAASCQDDEDGLKLKTEADDEPWVPTEGVDLGKAVSE